VFKGKWDRRFIDTAWCAPRVVRSCNSDVSLRPTLLKVGAYINESGITSGLPPSQCRCQLIILSAAVLVFGTQCRLRQNESPASDAPARYR
jgi:hypothetical protein